MFQTERMRKLRILTLNQYSSSIVNDLHEKGIVQIEDISERIQQNPEWADSIKPSKMTPFIGRISSLLMKTTGISETFGSALAGDTGIKDMILSFVKPVIPVKREVDSLDTESLVHKAESFLDEVESQTKVIEEKLSAIDSETSLVNLNEGLAQKLINFDLDLSLLKDTDYTTHIVGRINVESASKLKDELNNVTDNLLFFEDKEVSKEKDKTDSKVVIITALNEFKDEVLSVIRSFEFEKLEVGNVEGNPSQIISNSKTRLKELENEKSQVTSQLKEVAEKYDDDILILKEQLEIEKERNEVFATFGETDKTKMLEAWVPSKECDNVTNLIDKSSEGHFVVEFEEVGQDDSDVPVLHNNPSIVKPYEFLVGMYAPIKYGEIDPTFLVFLMFPFFFGFCLTEAAYGAIFAIIGIVLYKGIGKVNNTMKNFGAILIASGLWAIVLGLLTGGFMGDFFPRFFDVALPTMLIDPLKRPEIILIIALIIGLIHLNVGFILGIINNFRYGDKKEALGSQIVWFVLEIGIVFLALGFLVPAVGIIGMGIGAALLIATFVILMYCGGVYGIMDIFGFLGNWLSYARLLALCLSTGGIAMTVNILSGMLNSMIPIPVLGIILAVFIFIFGHIANFVLQIVGAFINALRLNYVEFFSQFFIGGKNTFNAFSAKRILTKLRD